MEKKSGNGRAKGATEQAGTALKERSALDAFRLPEGPVDLNALSTERTEIGPTDKKDGARRLDEIGPHLADLQERLFAGSTGGDRRRVLLVLQGMDTAGKDGIIDHVLGLVSPAGLRLSSFKKPTKEELEHDFLWRIEKQVPPAGFIGVFNRSHYEDVLIVRVHNLVPEDVWSKRYAAINEFEKKLVDDGVFVVKCFLHVSKEVQAERLAARLDDPEKYWKFNAGDIDERGFWDAYQEAYRAALEECSTAHTPWYVIPADHKWYRNWAVGQLLLETLQRIDPQFPPPSYDVEEQKRRLAAAIEAERSGLVVSAGEPAVDGGVDPVPPDATPDGAADSLGTGVMKTGENQPGPPVAEPIQ
jgi:PPK2 family polyphosphate:nucleotide phosphotransferase